MPIPHEVHNLLWRVVRPSTRQALHDAFEDWERAFRAKQNTEGLKYLIEIGGEL